MDVAQAIERLRARWGACFIDVRPGVAAVSDRSGAERAFPSHAAPQPKTFEAPTLAMALAAAIRGEGLGGQD